MSDLNGSIYINLYALFILIYTFSPKVLQEISNNILNGYSIDSWLCSFVRKDFPFLKENYTHISRQGNSICVVKSEKEHFVRFRELFQERLQHSLAVSIRELV